RSPTLSALLDVSVYTRKNPLKKHCSKQPKEATRAAVCLDRASCRRSCRDPFAFAVCHDKSRDFHRRIARMSKTRQTRVQPLREAFFEIFARTLVDFAQNPLRFGALVRPVVRD